MSLQIRLARESDIEGILSIYEPIVRTSHTSFEYEVPSMKEMWRRVSQVLSERPWLVAVRNEEVVGYSYATQVRGRTAYSWSAELSVYVKEGQQGSGIGKKLYKALMRMLELQGTRNFYGVISVPNKTSELFHEKLGFRKIAEFDEIGFKQGAWYGIAWYYLRIGGDMHPGQFRPLPEIVSTAEWNNCLNEVNS